MSPLLTNPHLIRGIYVGVPVFAFGSLLSLATNNDLRFSTAIAGTAAIATIAFSVLATSFSPLIAGICMGAAIGALVNGFVNNNNSPLYNIFSGTLIGGSFGFCALGFYGFLSSLEIHSYAFIDGRFVPIFTPK